MIEPIRKLGWLTILFIMELGRMTLFAGEITLAIARPPARTRLFMREMYNLGVLSLVIVCVSGLAVGMVLAYQGYHTLVRFGAERSLGAVIGVSLIRELGPVLTALLVAGRAGSATAAEIGLMATTEQLDGLRMMSIDPIHMVVKPRALAMTASMPLLVALFVICGLAGGYLIGVAQMDIDAGSYISGMKGAVDFRHDVLGMLVKGVAFGILVATIATYRGYSSRRSAQGVGEATTSAVVIASVSILLFDYLITVLWGG